VLIQRGRPVAAVVPLDNEDYFSMRLASDPRFVTTIERARARYAETGGRSLADIRRKHGLEPKARLCRAASRKLRSIERSRKSKRPRVSTEEMRRRLGLKRRG
jgi:antitoxin (DNA-binding transcriptional repressor) of toxin-antitoxin stability system